MVGIQITVTGLAETIQSFRSFTSQADELFQEAMLESARENIVVVAKTLAPKKTGALQGSIEVTPADEPMSVLICADKPYARFLEYGTRPHEIVVKNARVLHFQVSGKNVFAKRVQNPGIPEGKFSFINPAIEMGKEQLLEDLAQMIEEQLR